MTEEEKRIELAAVAFAKAHRTEIARQRTDTAIYKSEANAVSVFMSGSPGAGKTEASIELIESQGKGAASVLRIDPDELRALIPGYTGANSWLFQRAVIPLVEAIHDRALKLKLSFVMDGTLSSYEVAVKNVRRSLDKKRAVQILYVYQEPELAWQFVQAREQQEGRRIEAEDFVRQYFAAREVVNRLKSEFTQQIQVDLLMKNNNGSSRFFQAGVDKIDNYIPEKYSRADVRLMLGLK